MLALWKLYLSWLLLLSSCVRSVVFMLTCLISLADGSVYHTGLLVIIVIIMIITIIIIVIVIKISKQDYIGLNCEELCIRYFSGSWRKANSTGSNKFLTANSLLSCSHKCAWLYTISWLYFFKPVMTVKVNFGLTVKKLLKIGVTASCSCHRVFEHAWIVDSWQEWGGGGGSRGGGSCGESCRAGAHGGDAEDPVLPVPPRPVQVRPGVTAMEPAGHGPQLVAGPVAGAVGGRWGPEAALLVLGCGFNERPVAVIFKMQDSGAVFPATVH